MLNEGKSFSYIAKKLKVHRITVSKFITRMELEDIAQEKEKAGQS